MTSFVDLHCIMCTVDYLVSLVVFFHYFSLANVADFSLSVICAAGSLCSSLSSKFNLELLQSHYPNLYPVITRSLSALNDCSSGK